ncbi:DUF1761 domain-containing protein [Fulvivirgaceae bacterium BMA10]|uniref:DUF1761 domain-containing protein n=1 Tax=Splendidivirga corallicola TaxID=3051826 RepID=A0ABT8KL74_9BACT|nr:DUF1761 domain-containing protein [Fulvivirgaceae bacterium BMA10]
MKEQKINHLAVWISIIVVQFIPPFWYDKLFFGIRWMELNKVVEEDFADQSPFVMVWPIVAAIALAYLLAWLFKELKVDSAFKGLKLAFIFWFVFLFLEVGTQNAFTLRPFQLTLIDELVVLIKYEIMALMLALWRKYKTVEA